MHVLLVSTYELGHQPIGLASPAVWLIRAGHDVTCIDTSVDSFDTYTAALVDAIAISVPMHTAARIALQLTDNIRKVGITVPICFYGLYANVASFSPVAGCINKFISGEYEPSLVKWVDEIAGSNSVVAGRSNIDIHGLDGAASGVCSAGASSNRNVVVLDRSMPVLPNRDLLPSLNRYARLSYYRKEYLTGYVEATRGCAHKCLHCPVPSVYNGRIRKNDLDILLEDVDNLVSAGAQHITFGDPDFLNSPSYAVRVLSAVHDSFPQLTCDLTIKVSHIVKYADIFPELARKGCIFVVSAFESASDRILELLHKGHNLKDMENAVRILRTNRIEPRVSLMPFTPWTTRNDMITLLDMAVAFDLIPNIDPVQWAIRLLVPPGSLLLKDQRTSGSFRQFDSGKLSYEWASPDGELNALQDDLESIATFISEENLDCIEAFDLIRSRIGKIFDSSCSGSFERVSMGTGEVISGLQSSIAAADRPRLTESWFCCAEPMQNQLDTLHMDQAATGNELYSDSVCCDTC